MSRRLVCLLLFAVLTFLPALSARAVNPHLVVMAVNSGGDLVAPYDYDPPTMTPGAKGFLIGVDTGDLFAVDALLVYPMTFSGPGLVHKQGAVNAEMLPKFPRIMTRHEADAQSPVDATDYAPEDTYLIDKLSSSLGWVPVGEELSGGLTSDHFFTIHASPNPSGGTPMGVYPLAYVVTTTDIGVSGGIGWGGAGAMGWTPLGEPTGSSGTAVLDFSSGTIVPEPSSVILAALGVGGLLLFARLSLYASNCRQEYGETRKPTARMRSQSFFLRIDKRIRKLGASWFARRTA